MAQHAYDKEDHCAYLSILRGQLAYWHRFLMAVYLTCSKKPLWLRVPFFHWGCRHHRNTQHESHYHVGAFYRALHGQIKQAPEVHDLYSFLREGRPHAYASESPNTSDNGREDGDRNVDSDESELSLFESVPASTQPGSP